MHYIYLLMNGFFLLTLNFLPMLSVFSVLEYRVHKMFLRKVMLPCVNGFLLTSMSRRIAQNWTQAIPSKPHEVSFHTESTSISLVTRNGDKKGHITLLLKQTKQYTQLMIKQTMLITNLLWKLKELSC